MKIKYRIKEVGYILLSKLEPGDIVTVINTKQLPQDKRDWCKIDNLKKGDKYQFGRKRRDQFGNLGVEITIGKGYWHHIDHFNIIDDENKI